MGLVSFLKLLGKTYMSPGIIGIVAGIFTAVSLLPQLVKIIKEKQAENISYGMLIVLLIGLGCWVWYGMLREDWPIIITNSFSFLVNALVIIFTVKYKQHPKDSSATTAGA